MSPEVVPELKQIVGTLIFGANRPLDVSEIRRCLKDVAGEGGQNAAVFGKVRESDIEEAVEALRTDVAKARCGFHLAQVAGGYRFLSDQECGLWLRQLLDRGRPNRLSRPALETLAIIAYRQPAVKSQIESIRGVSVDHMLKSLMEMQLVRIVGRSELPGRPFQYGTTQTFLEHFGLKNLDELQEMEPMLLRMQERAEHKLPAEAEDGATGEPADETGDEAAEPEGDEASDVEDERGAGGEDGS